MDAVQAFGHSHDRFFGVGGGCRLVRRQTGENGFVSCCLCDENDLTEGGGPKNMNINIGYTFGRECEKTGRGGMRQSTSTPETALVVLACRLEKNASLMGWCLL